MAEMSWRDEAPEIGEGGEGGITACCPDDTAAWMGAGAAEIQVCYRRAVA